MTASSYHIPVMGPAIADLAAGRRRAVDGTAGGGGHTALLRDAGAEVLAIDRDPEAVVTARSLVGDERVRWMVGRFGAPETLAAIARFQPDLILLDLGVSSHQLDDDRRGFSFRPGVALDMRMTPSGVTAAEGLNTWPAERLTEILETYADERRARALAREIVRRRAAHPFRTSDDLVNAIRAVLGPRAGPSEFARIFQAIRIAVNAELDELVRALPALRDALVDRGVLAVIAYHSGEDRVVKHAFREWSRACVCPPDFPVCRCRGRPLGQVRTRRPLVPDTDECARNPRARSARLRVFERIDGG